MSKSNMVKYHLPKPDKKGVKNFKHSFEQLQEVELFIQYQLSKQIVKELDRLIINNKK